jgi:hypothetical protein
MKISFTILLFITILAMTKKVNGQQVAFLINGTAKNDTEEQRILSKGFNDTFLVDFIQAIQKEFPCAVVRNLPDANKCIEEMRLLGTPAFGNQNVGPKIKNLITSIAKSDYWVSYSLYPINEESAVAQVRCSNRKGKPLVEFSITVSNQSLLSPDIIEPVNRLVKQLTKYEICPYSGPINVEIKTDRTDKKTESYPVYCNGMDGTYKLDRSINKTSLASWKLNKTDKFQTSGTVAYTLREETETEEQNDCYICPSGRLGPRLYKETVLKTAKVEGLSNESIADNQQIEDARAEITFLDNGTYTLKVKAASRKGDLKLRTEKRAEGTCANQSPPPENITKKADVPLNEVTFGPFAGTSQNKVLSHKDTYSTVDPGTKEKTTITYDFNLKRD